MPTRTTRLTMAERPAAVMLFTVSTYANRAPCHRGNLDELLTGVGASVAPKRVRWHTPNSVSTSTKFANVQLLSYARKKPQKTSSADKPMRRPMPPKRLSWALKCWCVTPRSVASSEESVHCWDLSDWAVGVPFISVRELRVRRKLKMDDTPMHGRAISGDAAGVRY